MKEYNKLVRDRILEILTEKGVKFNSRIMGDEEYKKELLQKVVEEAQEVLVAIDDPMELIKELADLNEVIEAVVIAYELDETEIQKVKQERRDSRGGFEKKIFLESTEE